MEGSVTQASLVGRGGGGQCLSLSSVSSVSSVFLSFCLCILAKAILRLELELELEVELVVSKWRSTDIIKAHVTKKAH